MRTETSARTRVATIVVLYGAGLLLIGRLRYWQQQFEAPPALADHATTLYVSLTILAAVLLVRSGVSLQRLGFGVPIRSSRAIALAVVGIVVLQVSGLLLAPLWEWLFGAGRDLSRFSDTGVSPGALAQLLVLNWTFAAFGEELAFRILLLSGIAFVLGNDRKARSMAVILQAMVFGLVHAYQGPAGAAGSTISALVFGALVVVGRGSIWPAALAHGGNNSIGVLRLYFDA
jgi:membrane protease YdiL (CAAX protease family)